MRAKRIGIPDDLKMDEEMKRGETDWRITESGLSFLKGKDKMIVLMTRNFHIPVIEKAERKKKCPYIIKGYNANMGYVDKADMLKTTYEIYRKSGKWRHIILWHFVDVKIVDSYIIYSERCPGNSLSLENFRLSVVTGLVRAGMETSRRGTPSEEMAVNRFKPNVSMENQWDQSYANTQQL
ncbi:hypothetical protein JTB14_003272 [Gonioctena quinquepunctata]|nr:hypothetical protein JTB14_003272 [Gonioctena quinquepunctata]